MWCEHGAPALVRDDELIEMLTLSLNPDDNARARWLVFLRAEQMKILWEYQHPQPKKKKRKKRA